MGLLYACAVVFLLLTVFLLWALLTGRAALELTNQRPQGYRPLQLAGGALDRLVRIRPG